MLDPYPPLKPGDVLLPNVFYFFGLPLPRPAFNAATGLPSGPLACLFFKCVYNAGYDKYVFAQKLHLKFRP